MISSWKQRHERRRQKAVVDLQAEVGLRLNRAIDAHISIEEQVQPFFKQLTQTNHQISVQQFMLDMLIASHPAIELLALNWNANKPNVVDELHEFLPYGDDVLRQTAFDAWQEGLRHYSEVIEQTLKAKRSPAGKV
jgi:hypothetical protein